MFFTKAERVRRRKRPRLTYRTVMSESLPFLFFPFLNGQLKNKKLTYVLQRTLHLFLLFYKIWKYFVIFLASGAHVFTSSLSTEKNEFSDDLVERDALRQIPLQTYEPSM